MKKTLTHPPPPSPPPLSPSPPPPSLPLFLCRNNQLRSLPAELALCVELRDLVLSFNRFREIPSVVYQLKKLEHIIADDNQVCVILCT